MKTKKWIKRSLIIVFFFVLLQLPNAVYADTVSDNTAGGDTETIQYKTVKEKQTIYLLYHEKRVIISNLSYEATVTSSNTKVLQVANNGLAYGRKVGKATVTVTEGNVKKIYKVEVKKTVDLILFAGQSNMYGTGGDYALAPSVPDGEAYEYDIMTGSKKTMLMKEPFGRGTQKSNWFSYGYGFSSQGTIASAFCINYFKQTKTPVVGVFAAWGGISTDTWLEKNYMKDSVNRLKEAKKYLKKKNIKIRNIYVVWYQGETDGMMGVTQEKYIQNMKTIMKKYKAAGAKQMFVIQIGHHQYDGNVMKNIQAAQVKLCQKNKDFTLATKVAPTLEKGNYHADALHINQYGLNKIGYDAGKNVGKYAKKHSK